ncbi:uncharacterized protein BDR25DRAFT_347911 [Lindgomyces ingoldianus]|uniref:Uncharacterized protein n=1 Tax=Lindgomyces ingoldianus TaxID=673940 RepID=A0ACB6RGF3_9PLEO|nr:uncharacterized protein BDR25DRAFT_347911 [Lindgomyces ingoldianus]KAF2477582.1 hypothetical protein BDR25DRAFT_347911 [Lindgomyces ingoldianus]
MTERSPPFEIPLEPQSACIKGSLPFPPLRQQWGHYHKSLHDRNLSSDKPCSLPISAKNLFASFRLLISGLLTPHRLQPPQAPSLNIQCVPSSLQSFQLVTPYLIMGLSCFEQLGPHHLNGDNERALTSCLRRLRSSTQSFRYSRQPPQTPFQNFTTLPRPGALTLEELVLNVEQEVVLASLCVLHQPANFHRRSQNADHKMQTIPLHQKRTAHRSEPPNASALAGLYGLRLLAPAWTRRINNARWCFNYPLFPNYRIYVAYKSLGFVVWKPKMHAVRRIASVHRHESFLTTVTMVHKLVDEVILLDLVTAQCAHPSWIARGDITCYLHYWPFDIKS